MSYLQKLIQLIKGKKTNILVFLAFGVLYLKFTNVIDSSTADSLLMILGFGSAATLHAAIQRKS